MMNKSEHLHVLIPDEEDLNTYTCYLWC